MKIIASLGPWQVQGWWELRNRAWADHIMFLTDATVLSAVSSRKPSPKLTATFLFFNNNKTNRRRDSSESWELHTQSPLKNYIFTFFTFFILVIYVLSFLNMKRHFSNILINTNFLFMSSTGILTCLQLSYSTICLKIVAIFFSFSKEYGCPWEVSFCFNAYTHIYSSLVPMTS